MKAILTVLLLFSTININQASAWVGSSETKIEQCEKLQPFKRDDYWPWSLARPFPWKDIQGLWRAEYINGATSYFTFTIVRSDKDVRQLRVIQYRDLDSCEILGRGVGREYDNQINAQMTTKDGVSYRMLMAAFDPKDLAEPVTCSGAVMGMSIIPMGPRPATKPYNMPLVKEATRVTCRNGTEK